MKDNFLHKLSLQWPHVQFDAIYDHMQVLFIVGFYWTVISKLKQTVESKILMERSQAQELAFFSTLSYLLCMF